MPRVTLYIYIHIAPFAGSGPPLRRAAALILGENVITFDPHLGAVKLRNARWRAYDIIMIRRSSRATGGDLRSRASASPTTEEREENRVLLMPILGKNGVTVPRGRSLGGIQGGYTGRPFDAKTRTYLRQAVAARLVPRRPGGRRPVSPAEISVHSGVNEPISSGKRSPWTNGIWLSRGRA